MVSFDSGNKDVSLPGVCVVYTLLKVCNERRRVRE